MNFYFSNKEIINTCLTLIGIVIAYLTFILPIVQTLRSQNISRRDKRFTTYHSLIDGLVGGSANQPMLDKQIVIVYELRNFPEYYSITERILNGLKLQWQVLPNTERLTNEIDLTLNHIKYHKIIFALILHRIFKV